MSDCNWDPKKHKNEPCPIHGGENGKLSDKDAFDDDYEEEFKDTVNNKPAANSIKSKTGYQNGEWYIISGNGNWYIKDNDSQWTYSGGFSSDEDAEDFINNHEDLLKEARFKNREDKSVDIIKTAKNRIELDNILKNLPYEMIYSDKVHYAVMLKQKEFKESK